MAGKVLFLLVLFSSIAVSWFVVHGQQYIFFASEINKYIVVCFFISCMFFFKRSYNPYAVIVFFIFLPLSISTPIATLFYPSGYDFLYSSGANTIQAQEAIILLSVFYLFFQKKIKLQRSLIVDIVFFIIFIYYITFLSFFSTNFSIAICLSFTFIKILIYYVIFVNLLKYGLEQCLNAFILSIVFLILIEFSVSIMQQSGIQTFTYLTNQEFEFVAGAANRVSGTIGRTNLHKLFTICLPFLLAYSFGQPKSLKKIFLLISFLLGMSIVGLTRNRGPVIALFLGNIYVLYKSYSYRIIVFNLKHISILLIAVFAITYSFAAGSADVLELIYRESYRSRIDQALFILQDLKDNFYYLIFGFSPGSFKINFNTIDAVNFSYFTTAKNTFSMHNQYILFLYEIGICGLVLFLLWIYEIFKKLTTLAEDNKFSLILKIGIAGSLISFLISGLFRPLFANISLPFIALYLALIYHVKIKIYE